MNLEPVVILGGAAVLVIGAIFFLGMRLARTIEKKAPSGMTVQVTRTGVALYGCMIVVLVMFAAATTLEPAGPLGSLLRRPEGLVAVLVATVVFFSVAAWLFERIGYPISRRKNERRRA
jgi:hypothetical protein